MLERPDPEPSARRYADAASFEADLNAGKNVYGSIVTLVIRDLAPDSPLGYNVQAGEHLNFIFDEDPDVSIGDTITVMVGEATSLLQVWVIPAVRIS